MPNHVHAVVVPERADSMAKGFGRAHNAYSRYLNTVQGRSGHLWQNRFYSCALGRTHLLSALAYVDLNPVLAGLVKNAVDHEWSSARAHVPDLPSRSPPISPIPPKRSKDRKLLLVFSDFPSSAGCTCG